MGWGSRDADPAYPIQRLPSKYQVPMYKSHNLSVVVSKFQRRKQEDNYQKLKTYLSYLRARLRKSGTVTVLYSFIPFAFYVNKDH